MIEDITVRLHGTEKAQLMETIIQQDLLISRLKCCGNCKCWSWIESRCITPMSGKTSVRRKDTCNEWEGI